MSHNQESCVDGALPNGLIVGPMKCGTSWLSEYLKSRSDVCLPSGVKETFYFDQRYESKSLAWYLSHFTKPAAGSRVIEIAPTYFQVADLPARAHQVLGEIPIIVTLRDPANRAFSLYQHMRRYGFTRCTSFRDTVEKHPEVLAGSRYATCLQRWIETFGDSNVTVLFMEDLKDDSLQFVTQCCHALGLEPPADQSGFPESVNVASIPRNYYVAWMGRRGGDLLRSARLYGIVEAAKKLGLKQLFFGQPQTDHGRQRLSKEDRRWFITQLGDEIDRLMVMVNRDLSDWKSVS
jgi:Sulfotransferase domain